jgi:hypothetical protein
MKELHWITSSLAEIELQDPTSVCSGEKKKSMEIIK